MSTEPVPVEAVPPTLARPAHLRLWPVIPVLLYMIGAKLIQPMVEEWTTVKFSLLLFGPMICCLLVGLWWLCASRVPWTERLVGLVGALLLAGIGRTLAHPSLQGLPMPFMAFVLPAAVIASTLAIAVFSFFGPRVATIGGLLVAAITFGYWDTIRLDGMWGDFKTAMHWRWDKTAEDAFLAQLPAKAPAAASEKQEPLGKIDWAQFRGPNRDGIVPGVALAADWKGHSPKEIWRHKIGPGWSSFAVAGNRIFTQEQRGKNELVVCYDAKTGEERWIHESPARFDEAMGGVGPRATPTLSGGLLFAQGATGLLQCFDPVTGALKWERDIKQESNRDQLPIWGFAASPLVVGKTVIAYAGGKGDFGLLAYDTETGEPKWHAATGDDSYSSPQLSKLAGREVILLLANTGLSAVDPQTGKAVWDYEWKNPQHRTVQPLLVDASSVVLGTGMGTGTRRVEVVPDKSDAFKFEDRWTTLDIKPDFNDYVAYDGYLYGLDHNILCCIDLKTGTKKWKNGRYGNGQILLLPDAGQLLVLSETGELVLIRANPTKLEELARHKVLEGKTWNHPVLVKDKVYVRNAEEVSCFEVPLASQSTAEPKKTGPKEL
jgi:outer membrane protein assembly factor BamB